MRVMCAEAAYEIYGMTHHPCTFFPLIQGSSLYYKYEMTKLTFGYCQKTEKDKAILVRPSSIVMDVPNGEIYWPIFRVSSGNRNCCFITTKNDGYKHGPMCHGVFSDHILQLPISVGIRTSITKRLPRAAMPNCLT